MTLVWLLTLMLSFNTHSFAGTVNDKTCIEWMLSQYPDLEKTVQYYPEHDLLIERLPGPVRLIHSSLGSVASVPSSEDPEKAKMHCGFKKAAFGNRQVQGISGFLNAAMEEKLSGFSQEGKSPIAANSFLMNMPFACEKTSYTRLTENIKAGCRNAAKNSGAPTIVIETTYSICKGKLK